MEITEVKQDYIKPVKIRVLNWQLNFKDLHLDYINNLSYVVSDNVLVNQFNKIFEIASQKFVDLIVLPELSVPANHIKTFQEYSSKFKRWKFLFIWVS